MLEIGGVGVWNDEKPVLHDLPGHVDPGHARCSEYGRAGHRRRAVAGVTVVPAVGTLLLTAVMPVRAHARCAQFRARPPVRHRTDGGRQTRQRCEQNEYDQHTHDSNME